MRIASTHVWATAAAALLVAVGVPGGASEARADDNLHPSAIVRLPRGGGRWQGSLGLRTALIRSAGFDPFSRNDTLTQLSGSLTRAFGAGPGLVPVVGLVGDIGEAQAGARGVPSSLSLARVSLALEARLAPAGPFYAMARLAPGVMRALADLSDPSVPASLQGQYWAPTVDASVGGGARITVPSAPLGLWVLADGGYGWAPARDLVLRPSLPDSDAGKAGAVHVGSLAARGAFLRIGVALSY